MDLLSSFSTADAVDIRSELTRVARLEPSGRSARQPGGRTRRAQCDPSGPCGSCLVAHLHRYVQGHCCGGADRGAMSADERFVLLESGLGAHVLGGAMALALAKSRKTKYGRIVARVLIRTT